KGDTHRAIAGDFVLGMMQTMGLSGVVVDGAIRDITDAKELDFPIFCKATTVAAGNKHGAGELNVPITCGGVVVEPGDIVACDRSEERRVGKEWRCGRGRENQMKETRGLCMRGEHV